MLSTKKTFIIWVGVSTVYIPGHVSGPEVGPSCCHSIVPRRIPAVLSSLANPPACLPSGLARPCHTVDLLLQQ